MTRKEAEDKVVECWMMIRDEVDYIFQMERRKLTSKTVFEIAMDRVRVNGTEEVVLMNELYVDRSFKRDVMKRLEGEW